LMQPSKPALLEVWLRWHHSILNWMCCEHPSQHCFQFH
jgi:hypothetical protein